MSAIRYAPPSYQFNGALGNSELCLHNRDLNAQDREKEGEGERGNYIEFIVCVCVYLSALVCAHLQSEPS